MEVGMGLFDDLAKGVLGGLGGGKDGAMGAVLGQLLSPSHGGLEGLVKKFEGAGLGDMIKGWISTGPNPAITPNQLQAALGPELLGKLAGQSGINPQDLLHQLSGHLPDLIDKLTPDGAAPSMDKLESTLGGLLGGFLGKKS
jgi:uncharacterized protein YidB (DUF937 family)